MRSKVEARAEKVFIGPGGPVAPVGGPVSVAVHTRRLTNTLTTDTETDTWDRTTSWPYRQRGGPDIKMPWLGGRGRHERGDGRSVRRWIVILRSEISAAHFCFLALHCFENQTRSTYKVHLNEGVYRVARDLLDIYCRNAIVMIYSEYRNKFQSIETNFLAPCTKNIYYYNKSSQYFF